MYPSFENSTTGIALTCNQARISSDVWSTQTPLIAVWTKCMSTVNTFKSISLAWTLIKVRLRLECQIAHLQFWIYVGMFWYWIKKSLHKGEMKPMVVASIRIWLFWQIIFCYTTNLTTIKQTRLYILMLGMKLQS